MDVDSQTKVLTRRITVHKSEILSGRDTRSQTTNLQLHQFIGQDVAALQLVLIIKRISMRYELTNYSSSTSSVYWSRLGSFGALELWCWINQKNDGKQSGAMKE